jgi:alkylation response protein AidB-like acyl-CoA dehydrogenase
MTPSQLLDRLFEPAAPEEGDGDLRAFLKSVGPGEAATPSAFERLVRVAARTSGRLGAAAAGHQASIRRLFPDTPDDAITAFCVSEEKGPRPSEILSALTPIAGGFRLNGTKRWGSMAPLADMLYVAASVGRSEGRNRLRMVRVRPGAAGLAFDTSRYADYADHMPIADLAFADVAVAPEDVMEDLVGLILQAHALSETPMARPADVVAMSAYFRAADALWARLGESWERVPEPERAAWNPGAGTLGIAARAREIRRQGAWSTLSPPSSSSSRVAGMA